MYRTNLYRLEVLVQELISLENRMSAGQRAWDEGTDECAMADCDPSDQFVLGEEAAELRREVFEITKDWGKE